MKKEKVCHLTSVHAYNDTRIFHKECVSLAQAKYDVSLIASVKDAFRERGIAVIPVGRWTSRYHRFLVIIPKILVEALKIKATVYHIHDPELLMIAPFLRLSGARVIYDIHEDYTTSIHQKTYLPTMLRGVLAAFFNAVEKSFSKLCIQIIAERYYIERFPNALEILNYPRLNGGGRNHFQASPPEGEVVFDSQYSWCLYTGNVTSDRGAFLHLELLKAHQSTAMAYIGKCSEELAQDIFLAAEQNNISRQRIRIIGIGRHVPRETIDYYTYSRQWLAGVALFPETPHYVRKELTKFFEYMGASLPIMCSNFPVWKNIVEKNCCGICVDVKEMNSISSAIEYLRSNQVASAAMGERGLKVVNELYNWKFEEEKLLDLYNEIGHRE